MDRAPRVALQSRTQFHIDENKEGLFQHFAPHTVFKTPLCSAATDSQFIHKIYASLELPFSLLSS